MKGFPIQFRALVLVTLAATAVVHSSGEPMPPLTARPPVDVALKWNTFAGSTGDNKTPAIAVDSGGNIYMVSSGYNWGTPIRPWSGGADAYVAKFNAMGALLWNTFLGGSQDDFAKGISLDAGGNIYIAGESAATWGSPIRPYVDSRDAFVAKLDPSGALLWNTFLGGAGFDRGVGIASDAGGNTCVTGWSDETWGTPLNPYGGGRDVFAAKLNSNGDLVWSTFLGSDSVQEYPSGIGLDLLGNIYIGGYGYGTWGTPINPLNTAPDVFAVKLNGAGAIVWNTFLGGTGSDISDKTTIDSFGNIYITGASDGTWGSPVNPFPTTDYYAALAAKVDSSGNLVWNTFMGGNGNNWGHGIAPDAAGNVFVTGYSNIPWGSPLLPYAGGYDAFITKLNASGTRIWNAFLGSAGGSDDGTSVVAKGSTDVIIAGLSNATWGTPLRPHPGGNDPFVAKLSEDAIWRTRHAVGDFDGDGADEAAIDFGASGVYLYDNHAWMLLSAANPESLLAADVDGDGNDEIIADFGDTGLFLWNAGVWNQLSAADVDGLAAGDVDNNGADELVCDFGPVGMWLLAGGAWTQLSGVNADQALTADLDATGGAEIIGDFGPLGLWSWNSGNWTQLSGVNADYVASGRWAGGNFLAGDFATTGLWQWKGGTWTQLSGANADYVLAADVDIDGEDEVVGDFGAFGLWVMNGGIWTHLSGADAEYMEAADTNADGRDDVAVDYATTGLWLWNPAAGWTQLSGLNAEYVFSGNFDTDGADELMVDFGAAGLWMYDQGLWTMLSSSNPE